MPQRRPQIGSTRGGAWATITGVDLQPGAKVRLGDSAVTAFVRDSATITISTMPHAAGTVDVIATNPGGLEGTLKGGYAYEPPDSFNPNGDWIAHAGPEYETDTRFTIRNNVLVSVSCDTSGPLTFAPAPSVRDGECHFSEATASRSPARWCRRSMPRERSMFQTSPLATQADGGLIRVAMLQVLGTCGDDASLTSANRSGRCQNFPGYGRTQSLSRQARRQMSVFGRRDHSDA